MQSQLQRDCLTHILAHDVLALFVSFDLFLWYLFISVLQ